jgi:3,4-dihydroxy 2-butanone 4-phosphate synthase/GTP cyclohydrolase II
VQPGHIFPLQAQDGGVLMRAGHTEAGCDLARMAGCTPAAVICEIMNDDGTMARLPELEVFASEHGLKIGTIADLISLPQPQRVADRTWGASGLMTAQGNFICQAFRDRTGGAPGAAQGHLEPETRCWCGCMSPVGDGLLDVGRSAHSWPLPTAGGATHEAAEQPPPHAQHDGLRPGSHRLRLAAGSD